MMKIIVALAIIAVVNAAPGNINLQAAASVDGDGFKPPITLDAGNVGVNFAGYHASAGLGGLLTGDATKGGLHAEAGTPFGQEAGAGLGGTVDANGQTRGGLYAGAVAGGGVGAAAGFSGSRYVSGGEGAAYGHQTYHQQAQYGEEVIEPRILVSSSQQVISEKSYSSAPKVVAEHTYQEAPVVHRTIIEKTVIPQYVEKTIQVPSYVEKTIRVPTVVEHKVRVAATPKITENTYNEEGIAGYRPAYGGGIRKNVGFSFNAGANAGGTAGAQKVILNERRPILRKQIYGGPGLLGGLFGSFRGGLGGGGGYGAGGYGGQSAAVGASAMGGGANFAYKSQPNPGFFNDIFNIPISTLGAVNNLLNGINGRAQAGGSLSVSNRYSGGAAVGGAY